MARAGGRSRMLEAETFPGARPGEVLEVTLSYSKGGLNYFTYKDDPRGYWLHVTPVTVEPPREGSAFTVRKFTLGAGIKSFVKPAKAYSAKVLRELVVDPALVEKLKAHVIEKRDADRFTPQVGDGVR